MPPAAHRRASTGHAGHPVAVSTAACGRRLGGGPAHDDLFTGLVRPGTDRGHAATPHPCARRHSAHVIACRAACMYAPVSRNLTRPPQVAPPSRSKMALNRRSLSWSSLTAISSSMSRSTRGEGTVSLRSQLSHVRSPRQGSSDSRWRLISCPWSRRLGLALGFVVEALSDPSSAYRSWLSFSRWVRTSRRAGPLDSVADALLRLVEAVTEVEVGPMRKLRLRAVHLDVQLTEFLNVGGRFVVSSKRL